MTGAARAEALAAVRAHLLLQAMAEDIGGYMDEHAFQDHIRRFVCGTAVHAERRAYEMAEVLTLLKKLGSADTMTRATRKKLQQLAALRLREHFGGEEPANIAAVLDALAPRPSAAGCGG